jgi:hypothetical protein
MTMQITIRGTEHATANEALVQLNFSDDYAIYLAGRYFTISKDEMSRLQAMGLQPTTLHHNEATGCIMTVPGNC